MFAVLSMLYIIRRASVEYIIHTRWQFFIFIFFFSLLIFKFSVEWIIIYANIGGVLNILIGHLFCHRSAKKKRKKNIRKWMDGMDGGYMAWLGFGLSSLRLPWWVSREFLFWHTDYTGYPSGCFVCTINGSENVDGHFSIMGTGDDNGCRMAPRPSGMEWMTGREAIDLMAHGCRVWESQVQGHTHDLLRCQK